MRLESMHLSRIELCIWVSWSVIFGGLLSYLCKFDIMFQLCLFVCRDIIHCLLCFVALSLDFF